jgi:hypothetical protein
MMPDGAEPCDAFQESQAEIERLRAAIRWTQEVRPGKTPSGGYIVRMTRDQFHTMRELSKGEKG